MNQTPQTSPPQWTLAQIQSAVDNWIAQWGYWSPLANLARLTEEVGELAREINNTYGEKPKKKSEDPSSVEDELADVLFVIVTLANSMDIDLTQAFEQVLHKYNIRDAQRWASHHKDMTLKEDTPQDNSNT